MPRRAIRTSRSVMGAVVRGLVLASCLLAPTAYANHDAGSHPAQHATPSGRSALRTGSRLRPRVTVRPRSRFHTLHVASAALGNTRQITLDVPEGPGRFPVLYTHDGQNLYDPARAAFGSTWELGKTVAALRDEGLKFIVVGVDNTPARMDELTPVADPEHGGGRGDAYLHFLVHELKPLIDARLPTRSDSASTFLAGSSLGGLMSDYAARARPDVFGGGYAALSPSFWWSQRWAVGKARANSVRYPGRVWLDAGGAEGTTSWDGANAMRDDAREAAYYALARGETVGYREDPGAGHNEAAWAARAPSALRFLFGAKSPAVAHVAAALHRDGLAPGEASSAILQLTHVDGRQTTVHPSRVRVQSAQPEVLDAVWEDKLVARKPGVAELTLAAGALRAQTAAHVHD